MTEFLEVQTSNESIFPAARAGFLSFLGKAAVAQTQAKAVDLSLTFQQRIYTGFPRIMEPWQEFLDEYIAGSNGDHQAYAMQRQQAFDDTMARMFHGFSRVSFNTQIWPFATTMLGYEPDEQQWVKERILTHHAQGDVAYTLNLESATPGMPNYDLAVTFLPNPPSDY